MPVVNEWNHKESKALLKIMRKYNCFQSNVKKVFGQPTKYQIIEKEMVSKGFVKRTAKQIKARWGIMKRQYDKAKKNNRTERFRYFKELDRMFGGRALELAERKNRLWTHNETKALLNILQEYVQSYDCNAAKPIVKYEIIEREMISKGFKKKKALQIKSRFSLLKRQYNSAKKSNQQKSFQYFNELDKLLGCLAQKVAQSKQRNKFWTHNETKALLNIMQEYNCLQSNGDKMCITEEKYKIIEKEMTSRGFMKITDKHIFNRWRNLKSQYIVAKRTNRTESFQYFNEFDRLLGGLAEEVGEQTSLWNDKETKALLNIIQSKDYKLLTSAAKYEKIGKEMNSRGFMKRPKQIIDRLRTLKRQYALAKKTNRTKYFQYFNELDRILSGRTSFAAINTDVDGSRGTKAQEAKQKMKSWTHNETKALLNIMQKFNCFKGNKYKSYTFAAKYERIEKEIVSRGFKRTCKEIQIRWHYLKCAYTSAIKHKRKNFRYFIELDRILRRTQEVVQTRQKQILWTHNETKALLDIMQEYNCFQNKVHSKYKIIEKEMISRGFMKKNPLQIKSRWQFLRNEYYAAKKNNQTDYCLYFNELDRLLGDRTSVTAINNAVDSSRDDNILEVEMNVNVPVVTKVQEVVQAKQMTKFPKTTNYKEMYMKRIEEIADNMTNTQNTYKKTFFKNQTKRIDNEFNIYEKNETEFIESSIKEMKEMLINSTKVFLNNFSQMLKETNSAHVNA